MIRLSIFVLTTKETVPMVGVNGSITFKTVLIPLFFLFVFDKVVLKRERKVFGG
jgi:hypothetical protein